MIISDDPPFSPFVDLWNSVDVERCEVRKRFHQRYNVGMRNAIEFTPIEFD